MILGGRATWPLLILWLLGGCGGAARPAAPIEPRPTRPGGEANRVKTGVFPDGDCRCWTGRLVGNDSDVLSLLMLCRRGESATGTLRWMSRRSGRSLRTVSGSLSGNELRLRDDRMLINEPLPTWRFCLVESYRLRLDEKSGDISGTYHSPKCYDDARVAFSPAARVRCSLSILRQEPLP
jgi:hypothetical protein